MCCLSALRSYQLPSLPPEGEHQVQDGNRTRKVSYYINDEPAHDNPNYAQYSAVDAHVQLAERIQKEKNSSLFRNHLFGVVSLLGAVLAAAYMIQRCIKATELSTMDKLLAAVPLLPALLSYLCRRNYLTIKKEAMSSYPTLLGQIEIANNDREDLYFTRDGLAKLKGIKV